MEKGNILDEKKWEALLSIWACVMSKQVEVCRSGFKILVWRRGL
jgi:hypothetical protein